MPVFHVTAALKRIGVHVCWLQPDAIMLLNRTQNLAILELMVGETR